MYLPGKVKFSIDFDSTILDVGAGNKIIGVELLDASDKFESLEVPMKNVLKNIKKSFLKTQYEKNSVLVKLGFISEIAKEKFSEGMTIQFPVKLVS